eukprot:11274111-Heterocapsa_arctica.AAC.1
MCAAATRRPRTHALCALAAHTVSASSLSSGASPPVTGESARKSSVMEAANAVCATTADMPIQRRYHISRAAVRSLGGACST